MSTVNEPGSAAVADSVLGSEREIRGADPRSDGSQPGSAGVPPASYSGSTMGSQPGSTLRPLPIACCDGPPAVLTGVSPASASGSTVGSAADPLSGSSSYLWLSACLIAASIEPIIVKLGYAANCTPWQLLCIKSVAGAILICPLTRQFKWIGIEGFKKVLPVALLLLSTGTLVLLSLQYIQASLLITIMTVTPAAVALVNQALGRDILGVKFWIGFLMSAAGLILTTRTEFQTIHIAGIALALTAVASSTTYRVLLEKVTKTYKPALVSTYIFLINGICLLPLLPLQTVNLTGKIIGCGLWLGAAAAVANVAFLYAISKLGSTRVSIITMLERPIVIAIAAFVLKENLSPLQIAGIILVIAGVQLAKVKRK